MNEQPLDRAAIRKCTTALSLELPAAVYDDYAPRVLALLDLLEQTERDLTTERCLPRFTLDDARKIATLEAERDVARRERDVARIHANCAEEVLARLTDERDDADGHRIALAESLLDAEAQVLRLQTALERLAGLLDPKVPPAPEPYLRQIVDDALAAVPVVPPKEISRDVVVGSRNRVTTIVEAVPVVPNPPQTEVGTVASPADTTTHHGSHLQ